MNRIIPGVRAGGYQVAGGNESAQRPLWRRFGDLGRNRGSDDGGEAGFTLVEVLVALAIMAVIGAAGLGVLDQVLRAQRQTEGRLERLGDMQRAMFVFSHDLRQATNTSLQSSGGELAFARRDSVSPFKIRYGVEDSTLVRYLSRPGEGAVRQVVIHDIQALSLRFWQDGAGWLDRWPPDPNDPGNPAAVVFELIVSSPAGGGVLRRVVLPPEAAQ